MKKLVIFLCLIAHILICGNSEAGFYDDNDFDGSVQIAVLDTGIDTDHPDLQANIAWTYDATGSGSVEDVIGHGTFVSGIIAADDNDIGIKGIAPNADLYVIKVIDDHDAGVSAAQMIEKGISAESAVAFAFGIVQTRIIIRCDNKIGRCGGRV